jgi:hypothetical protein
VRLKRQSDGSFKIESYDQSVLEQQGYTLANQAAKQLYGGAVAMQ